MKKDEKIFLNAIQAALWSKPLSVPEGFRDWAKVIELAQSQSVLGLVGSVLLNDERIKKSLSERIIQRLRSLLMQNVVMHSILNNTLKRVVGTLKDAGVHSVLLKGQGIAMCYPKPEYRQCGDIDLYVGVEGYERAYEVLLPMVSHIDDRVDIYKEIKHFHAHIGQVLIEVHRYTTVKSSKNLNELFLTYEKKGLTEWGVPVRFGDVEVMLPEDNFNVVYIFHHLWHHFITSGVGLRQFCDLACFLHTRVGHLDEDYIRDFLVDMDLLTPWKSFGCVLVDFLGLPEQEFPLYDASVHGKAELVMQRVLAEGNFGMHTGFARRRTKNYLYEKLVSFTCHVQRIVLNFRIFPRHAVGQLWETFKSGVVQIGRDLRKLKIH